ncbi:MAG: hypothetical protein NTW79_02420 [Candidatus Berkelbacteria bacterium]|nr:hypothetical protein [Candidatus Berkelbacteria bacterium]
MNKKELFYAGALLYACEGTVLRKDKRGENRFNYAIEFTNSKSQPMALFAKFLREIIVIDESRLRGQLFAYPDHNKDELISYWSNVSGIPSSQFQKVIDLKQTSGKFNPSRYGTFKLRYNNKNDFLKLQEIIEQTWRDAGVV